MGRGRKREFHIVIVEGGERGAKWDFRAGERTTRSGVSDVSGWDTNAR